VRQWNEIRLYDLRTLSRLLGLSIESALGGFFEDEIFLLTADQARDRRVTRQLRALGWSVCRIWECRLKQQPEVSVRRILRMLG
jgi:hypothetical protein